MSNRVTTVSEYLRSLPDDRRKAIEAVRKVILANLDEDYEEGIGYGMLSYHIPHRVFPAGYHCNPKLPVPFANIASQKNHMAIYLMCIYGVPEQEEWFRKAWAKSGKKLDMGKACVRFKKLEDLPLEVIGEAIRRVPAAKFLAHYQSVLDARPSRGSAARPAAKRSTKKMAKKTGKKVAKKAAKKTNSKTGARKAKATVSKPATAKRTTGRTAKKAARKTGKQTS